MVLVGVMFARDRLVAPHPRTGAKRLVQQIWWLEKHPTTNAIPDGCVVGLSILAHPHRHRRHSRRDVLPDGKDRLTPFRAPGQSRCYIGRGALGAMPEKPSQGGCAGPEKQGEERVSDRCACRGRLIKARMVGARPEGHDCAQCAMFGKRRARHCVTRKMVRLAREEAQLARGAQRQGKACALWLRLRLRPAPGASLVPHSLGQGVPVVGDSERQGIGRSPPFPRRTGRRGSSAEARRVAPLHGGQTADLSKICAGLGDGGLRRPSTSLRPMPDEAPPWRAQCAEKGTCGLDCKCLQVAWQIRSNCTRRCGVVPQCPYEVCNQQSCGVDGGFVAGDHGSVELLVLRRLRSLVALESAGEAGAGALLRDRRCPDNDGDRARCRHTLGDVLLRQAEHFGRPEVQVPLKRQRACGLESQAAALVGADHRVREEQQLLGKGKARHVRRGLAPAPKSRVQPRAHLFGEAPVVLPDAVPQAMHPSSALPSPRSTESSRPSPAMCREPPSRRGIVAGSERSR